jgi:hypothetical protein
MGRESVPKNIIKQTVLGSLAITREEDSRFFSKKESISFSLFLYNDPSTDFFNALTALRGERE